MFLSQSAGSKVLLRRLALSACLLLGISALPQSSASASDFSTTASVFAQLASNSSLANPAIVVLDKATGEKVFESNPYALRKPASVIKLLSATAAYTYLSPSDTYTTSLWQGIDSKTVVIQGALDPWISYNHGVATKMKRTSLTAFQWAAIDALSSGNSAALNGTTLLYSNLYPQDVVAMSDYFKYRKVKISLKRVSAQEAEANSTQLIFQSSSPKLERIIDWTLTWSDNLLAERIARAAAAGAGFTRDDAGVEKVFRKVLSNFNIAADTLIAKDGSGLSKANRISAYQVSQLLLALSRESRFDSLLKGLPIGGVSGTLSERFIDTAPLAVGLVKAKTGTLNGTTNLAGFVQSGDHEYIFVIIADQHSKSYTITKRVRAIVDRILGKIATPLLPEIAPLAPSGESTTAITAP